jgi:predicted metal-binding membrane protein
MDLMHSSQTCTFRAAVLSVLRELKVGKMTESASIEQVLRRDRMVVLSALTLVVFIAALYTIFGVGMEMSALEMTIGSTSKPGMSSGMDRILMPAAWSPGYVVLVFVMWWAMMIAMMVPSAAPAILLYAALMGRSNQSFRSPRLTYVFLAGYLAAWAAFSLTATGLQWALEWHDLISPMKMAIVSTTLCGCLLILAGAYQFTPFKNNCLEHCRSPFQFLIARHRDGLGGAFRMGLEHGSYCLGCCWFLMALLFVGGIMNLYWIAGLALFVAVEKLAPIGWHIGRVVGAVLITGGGWLLVFNYV